MMLPRGAADVDGGVVDSFPASVVVTESGLTDFSSVALSVLDSPEQEVSASEPVAGVGGFAVAGPGVDGLAGAGGGLDPSDRGGSGVSRLWGGLHRYLARLVLVAVVGVSAGCNTAGVAGSLPTPIDRGSLVPTVPAPASAAASGSAPTGSKTSKPADGLGNSGGGTQYGNPYLGDPLSPADLSQMRAEAQAHFAIKIPGSEMLDLDIPGSLGEMAFGLASVRGNGVVSQYNIAMQRNGDKWEVASSKLFE